MDRLQELETVKTAYFLENRLESLRQENKQLSNSKPSKPMAPVEPKEEHKKVVLKEAELKSYPDIVRPEIKLGQFWKRGVILLIVGFVALMLAPGFALLPFVSIFLSYVGFIVPIIGIVLLIMDWRKAKQKRDKLLQEHIEKVKNSEEYKNECRIIDEYNQKEQQRVDELNRAAQAELDKECHEKYLKRYETYKTACQEYQIRLKEYDEEIIPNWKTELSYLTETINQTENVLQELYNKKVIPIQYCNLSTLCYLTMFLSTSEFDLKFAIERYDMLIAQTQQREQINLARAQLQLGREALENQQYANWLNEQLAEISKQGNKTLKSISNWQKADMLLDEYRHYKSHKATKKSY